ncbi:hypothetical protein MKX08_003729 [Trichoderma sp. CBMAI-0020]|nr:hypothetical protein MKX08_003729 [Trichoderma sp. CBMAI-0020]
MTGRTKHIRYHDEDTEMATVIMHINGAAKHTAARSIISIYYLDLPSRSTLIYISVSESHPSF